MARKPLTIDRAKALEAIHKWCAGRFDPLIAFPPKGGFSNVIYLYEANHIDMQEAVADLMAQLYKVLNVPVMVFVEPSKRATGMALKYKQWIEAGSTMKAIELVSNKPVYVMPVYSDSGDVERYVSSDRSYAVNELQIIKPVGDDKL